jgi:hypothetical protein
MPDDRTPELKAPSWADIVLYRILHGRWSTGTD